MSVCSKRARNNRLRAFWPEPVSIFGSLGLTMLMAVHLCWAFHPACPPTALMLAVAATTSRRFLIPRMEDVVSAASDPTVASRAGADRLLRTESQVWFTHFISCQTITVTPSFRTGLIILTLAMCGPRERYGEFSFGGGVTLCRRVGRRWRGRRGFCGHGWRTLRRGRDICGWRGFRPFPPFARFCRLPGRCGRIRPHAPGWS
jgi:hypothetical protein